MKMTEYLKLLQFNETLLCTRRGERRVNIQLHCNENERNISYFGLMKLHCDLTQKKKRETLVKPSANM